VAKAYGAFARDISQQDVGLPEDRHGVEEIEGPWPGQVALADVSREAAVLAPLNVDHDLGPRPRGVKYLTVPVSPNVGRGVSRVVAYPEDLFIGWNCEGNPGPVDVVAPEQMVGDDPPDGVQDGDHTFERERFIPL
jgi:hypothetical protein